VRVRIVVGCILAGIVSLNAPVEAQDLSISIANGDVTMVARDVPLQQVFSELARKGNVTVSGADKIGVSPVTLELNGVDARVAFEILLRNTGGYVLISRQDAAPGALPIERVLILPENTASRQSAQSEFGSQSDPDAAFQRPAMQTNPEVAAAVEASPSPVEVSPPQPTSTRPSPSTAVPTFAVPVGFSGRPGDRVLPPPRNIYGRDTTGGLPPQTGTVLGATPK